MKTSDQINIHRITAALETYRPAERPVNDRGHAAVALLLRERAFSTEVLFIIRATHERDPWSGNIGFPGGRLNHGGETPQQAAERETLEELSLDLGQARYLGRLDDLADRMTVAGAQVHGREARILSPGQGQGMGQGQQQRTLQGAPQGAPQVELPEAPAAEPAPAQAPTPEGV